MKHKDTHGQGAVAGIAGRTGWLLALVPAAMLLGLMARRVWDVDIFWQLKLGEMILAQKAPVSTEPFSALHQGEPLPSVAWLGQALMAGVRLLGGWGALRVFDAVCWLGGFWAVAAACRKRGSPMAAVALALVLAMFAALPTASIRPQSFAALCFGLLLALQRLGLRQGLMLAIGVPLMLLWQNLHPSVTVGAMAMGLSAMPGWLAWLRRTSRTLPWAQTLLALFGLAALFLTPDGAAILAVSAANAEMSIAIGASEWLPLWIRDNWTNAVPVLVVFVLTVRMALRGKPREGARFDAGEVLVALALFALTLTAYRFVLFWAVAMVPVIARAIAAPAAAPTASAAPRWLAPAAVAAVAIASPFVLPTRFADTIPLEAVARLRQEPVKGTVYADFPFGGAIVDAGWPDWRVAYDGRYYRYDRQEWQYNGGIENGIVPLGDVVRKWRPAAFLLNVRHNAPLAQALARSPKWKRIYAKNGIVIYLPRTATGN